jgi:hypothetical protein
VQTSHSSKFLTNLGPVIACYGPRRRRWREAWIWPLPGFILACALIISGLDWYYYGYTQYGPIAAQSWSQNWLFWGMFVCAITLLITAWQIFRTRTRVILFRYGVQIHTPFRKPYSLHWENITGVASATIQDSLWGRILRIHHRLTMFTTLGKPITLDDRIDNLLELITRIKANLYPRLLPGLRAQYKAGQKLIFGPLSIHKYAITVRDKQIPWEAVNHITMSAGLLVVETRNQEAGKVKITRIPVMYIPNLELLLQIIQWDQNQQP